MQLLPSGMQDLLLMILQASVTNLDFYVVRLAQVRPGSDGGSSGE